MAFPNLAPTPRWHEIASARAKQVSALRRDAWRAPAAARRPIPFTPAEPRHTEKAKPMLTIPQLENLSSDSKTHVAAMQRIFDRHQNEADQFKGDTTRSAKFIEDTLRQSREKAMAELSPHHQALAANMKTANKAADLWENKEVVLSRIPMATNPVEDATLRSAKLAEFNKMSPNTLDLIARDAVEEGNLPIAWLAKLAGATNGEGDHRQGFSLSEVTIASQDIALNLVKEVFSDLARGEMLVAQTAGRINGATKLELARRVQDGVA